MRGHHFNHIKIDAKTRAAANKNQKEKEYWIKKLSGQWTKTSFPPHHKKTGKDPIIDTIKSHFPPGIFSRLTALGKENHHVLHIYLAAALAVLLSKYTNQKDIITGTPIYKQTVEKEFINTILPLRIQTPGDITGKELLKQVKQTIVEAIAHQNYPTLVLPETLNLPHDEKEFPLFDTALLIENIHDRKYLDPIPLNMIFSFNRKETTLETRVEYNAALYARPAVERMINHLDNLLETFLFNLDAPVIDIDILSAQERKQLLITFNRTAAPYPEKKTLPGLFEEQAAKTPLNTAVSAALDLSELYRQLTSKKKNNQLHHHLTGQYETGCFQINPYLFVSDLQMPQTKAVSKIVKTHRHNSVIMNTNAFKLLRLFDGKKNLKSLFSQLKNRQIKLLIYPLSTEDVLEISYDIKNKTEILFNGKIKDLIRIVNVFYSNHLIELIDIETRPAGLAEVPADYFDLETDEPPGHQIHPTAILRADRPLSKARVLFLGDTTGMATTGLLYLASYLERNNITTCCRFYDIDRDHRSLKQNIVNLLEKINPELVAISMKWFLHIARVLEICKIVKEYSNRIKLVVGGNTASYYPEQIINCEYIDYLVRGDGEVPLLEICREEPVIQNCTYKKNKKLIDNPITYIENKTNGPDIYLSHLDEILLSRRALIFGSFFIYTHKGCLMNCLYCGGCHEAHRKKFNRSSFYRRGVPQVRKDIIEAKKFTSTFFFDFDAPNQRLLEYCREIWENIDLSSHFCILGNLLPPSPQLVDFANNTFKYVYWNLDIASLSGRHRRELFTRGLVKPQPTDAEILSFLDTCQAYDNAEVRINLIAGLPFFTEADIKESERVLHTLLDKYTCLGELHWARLHAQPGAPVLENAGAYDMHSLASSYHDFLEYSQKNFRNDTPYPGVEYFDYPYIYYNDDRLNSKISKHYADMNREIEYYKENKRKKQVFYQRVTYKELDRQATHLARQLQQKGIKNDSTAALLMDSSIEMTVGILGILKAGGAYLPINPDYPEDRIKYMLKDSNATVLVTTPGLSEKFEKLSIVDCQLSIVNEMTPNSVNNYRLTINNLQLEPTDLAYLIYTSGTTGSPKGTAVNHTGIVNYTLWRQSSYYLKESDVTLQLISYTFDGFGSNFYSALLSGGELVLIPDAKKLAIEYIKEVIKDRKVTNMSVVPGIYDALLQSPGENQLNTLRFVVLAGETAGPHILKKSKEKYPHIKLINEYGPTETTITAVARIGMQPTNPAIIGKPINNTCIYILAPSFQPVPIGVFGELTISGPGVARGYLNNPELTIERFCLRRPGAPRRGGPICCANRLYRFSFVSGLGRDMMRNSLLTLKVSGKSINRSYRSYRSYKSGDLARWLPDGSIEFLGRIDHQLKIRGFRIEPGEIENLLLKQKNLKDAVVLAKQDQNHNKYICAYIVPGETHTHESPYLTKLKQYLAGKLPGYMMPDKFVFIEKIPLTPHGKVDKKTLSELEDEMDKQKYTAPRDDIEKKIAGIWAGILGKSLKSIGIDHRFFDLGGHSLKAAIMIANLHKVLHVRVPLVEFFKRTTIREMAQYIKGIEKDRFIAVQPIEKRDYYPVSPAQKRLYILQEMEKNNTGYNEPITVILEGNLDIEKLEHTFLRFIQRHESLRTSFEMVENEPVQRVHDKVEFKVKVEEKKQTTDDRRQRTEDRGQKTDDRRQKTETQAATYLSSVIRHLSSEFVRPFDLSRAPLLRAGIIKIGKNKHLLIVDMHHIITDGTSVQLLIREFMPIYREQDLPPLRLRYKDYSLWQNRLLQSGQRKKQESYWLEQFNDEIPVLNMPMDFPRPALQSFAGQRINFEIDATETSALNRFARHEQVTLFMLLLALYNVLLHRLSGQEDIIAGVPAAGRRHTDLQQIIGMFVNTLALRNYPAALKSFREFITEIKNQALKAFENQEYPFEDLVEKVVKTRDMSRNPLFSTLFSLQNMELDRASKEIPQSTPEKAGELVLKPGEHQNPISKFDLALHSAEDSGKLFFTLEYCTKLFKETTIHRFINYFRSIVAGVLKDPDQAIGQIDILSPWEKQQLLEDFNGPRVEYAGDKTLHQWFAEQAAAVPDATAVHGYMIAGNQGQNGTITYKELNKKSHQLANALKQKGTGTDSIIGIVIERSIEMVTGILGILKAGGAYLPIDPDYPEERIDYMLKDSGAKILLTGREIAGLYSPKAFKIHPKGTNSINNYQLTINNSQLNSSTLAYVIYTSGSTGKPKGVMLEHRNLVNLVHYHLFYTNIDTGRVMQFATISFDASFHEIFSTLLSGGQLYLVDRESRGNITELLKFLEKNRIKTVFLPMSLLKVIFSEEESIKLFPVCVRHIQTAGEQVVVSDKTRDYLKRSQVFLHNHYGPSETHVVTALTIAPTGNIPELPPIGKPLINTSIYILGTAMQPQPAGVPGELYIAGIQVGRGYLNNPELTAKKFLSLSHRFHRSYNAYIYQTGDLARWLPDGNIEFLGRIDLQVKIRGFRVEPGEIEIRLLNHPYIKEAVVSVRRDRTAERYLCAYFVSDGELTQPEQSLRKFLSKYLPDYMVPSYFVQLESIPTTPSGKVNRNALPAPGIKTSERYIPPTHEIEKKLAGIWSEILDRDALQGDIGIDDNFFILGGNSLKSIIMISRLHKELNIKLPLARIFKTPTIRDLAGYIKKLTRQRYISIGPVEKKEYYVLSSAQKRLYILQQMDPAGTAYNLPIAITLTGKAGIRKLEEIFGKLIDLHESLRTSFHLVGGETVQKIHGEAVPFGEYLATEDTENTGEEPAANLISSFIRPFDLSRAPLLRVGLIKNRDEANLLLLDMHHIISDGMSHGILERDFITLFNNGMLPVLKIQYKDYSEWQNSREEKKKIKHQEAFWIKEFTAEIPVLGLPLDYSRPMTWSYKGNGVTFELPGEQTAALKRVALTEHCTLYVILLALTNILLSKLSSQEDIVIGTPVLGRRHADLEQVIGMFVNTLALRNHPNGEKNLQEFLQEVKNKTLVAFENQEYPFEDLVDKMASSITRDTGRNPLFDVMLVYRDPAGDADPTGKSPAGPQYWSENRAARFDLTITAGMSGERLSIDCVYGAKLFKKETIARFMEYFKRLTALAIENPRIKLWQLDILSKEEKKEILVHGSGLDGHYPRDKTLHQLFEKQAEKTPNRIALMGVHETHKKHEKEYNKSYRSYWSYNELNRQSNRLAYLLKEKGVKPDNIVGIMVERSIEMIAGLLAILKAGGAYLPIDPGYPEERIDYMLKDSSAQVLVTTPGLSEKFEKLLIVNCQLLIVNDMPPKSRRLNNPPKEANSINNYQLTINNLQLKSSNLAYLIYTSGTTGRPKGVMIQHRNVVRLIIDDKFQFDFNSSDRWTLFHSYCFDFSVWEIYGALLYGGTLIIVPKSVTRDPALFRDRLERSAVTVLNQTPSAFYHLQNEELQKKEKKLNLRYVIFGGEALKPAMLKKWQERYPRVKLINMYGITETTVHVTYKEINHSDIQSSQSNIGKPIPTLNAYVVDKHLQLQPIGTPGELVVSGEGVGRGYLNQPQLTAEKFDRDLQDYRDKNKKSPPKGIYRSHRSHRSYITYLSYPYKTGDLVRLLPGGDLEYLGRIDQQVKIRGYRIELAEIVTRLQQYEHIKEAVVTAGQDKNSDKYLTAYIVPAPGPPIGLNSNQLREYLSKYLPGYMVPAYFVLLEKIPLTPNGKIDYKALPPPQIKAGEGYQGPRDAIERKLVEIWGEVLGSRTLSPAGQPQIGINDNFFQLGGHSLKAAMLAAKIHKELNVKLPLAGVFTTPTVKEQARRIKMVPGSQYVSLQRIEKREYYPLSSAQKRLYIMHQMNRHSTAYNISAVLPLAGQRDTEKLEKIFRKLIRRHESLRTSFHMKGGQPVQRVHEYDEVEFQIEYYDIETVEEEEQRTEDRGQKTETQGATHLSSVIRHLSSEFIRPFDLSRAPLVHVGLIQSRESKDILLVNMHHIISDGISQLVMALEFETLYEGHELAPLRVQYKDFSAWQNDLFAGSRLNRQKEYWLNRYAGEVPRLRLPQDHNRPGVFTYAGANYDFTLEKEEAEKFKRLSALNNGTLFMNFLAALETLFYKYTGQTDIIIGTEIAGRPHDDLRQIIGMFVNTLALRNYPEGNKTYEDFLKEVIDSSIKAFENQDVQFEELVDQLELERDPARNPLFDISIVVQNFRQAGENIPQPTGDENITSLKYRNTSSKYDMTFFVLESEQDIYIDIRYYTAVFEESTIKRLAVHFKNLVKAVLEQPAVKLKDIGIISPPERKQLLYDFNETAGEYPKEKTLHRLFAEQVERTPEHIAVVGPSAKKYMTYITYRELNEKSGQLAGYLREKGLKTGTIAGIMAAPSIETLIGVLAILKAGGAYLPIDPELPEERIQYMLYDSSTKFLMTTPGLPGKLSIINCQLLIVNDMSPESRRLNNPPKEANSINNYQLTINNLQLESSHLAYLIYTSGTTGKPGGVLITHRNLVNYVTWFTKEAGITREDKAVLVSSFAFDLGYTAVYPSLLNGAQLHIAAREVYLSPRKLIDYIALSGITFIKLTPSLYSTLAAEPGFPREISKNLKLVVLGGETINVKDIQKSIAGNRLKIMNHYGPTEATIGSVAHLIDPGKIDNYKKYPTIGKPIHNTKVFILDKDLKLLPRGVPGELCIAGIGVARGYLNNPELTFERFCLRRSGTPRRGGPICCANRLYRFSFVSGLGRDMMRNSLLSFPSSHLPNFSASLFSPPRKNFSLEAPGSRIYRSYRSHMSYIYRTGDLAKWLFNGNIIFLGRIDRQVKIRGFRIETGEIENRLLKYKGIQSAVVLPSPDNRSLCAYYVPAKNAHFTIHRLEEFLAKFLPRHMVPAYFVSLDSIPLTPNRKVDKKALPHPGKQRQTQYIAPRNEIEKKLSGIWSQLLKKEKIGIDDNFFQLGGNSIDLIRFVSTAYREFGIELPVTHVYGNPRISAISQYIISGQLAESEYVLLNPGKTRTLFAFPPGVGYGLVYKNLSLQLDEYSIYAFNFIEGENRLEKYMEIITALQSTGPYILLGWSAAGGIIFEVTAYLEKKGCKVSDIILLDAYWKKDKPTVDNDRQQLEMSDEFLKGVERELELLEMEFYRERVFKKIEKYREYNLNLRELETVGARVHLIAAADNVNPEQYSDWEEFTLNTFKIYKGFGAHVDMLSPGTLEKNAALIKTIL